MAIENNGGRPGGVIVWFHLSYVVYGCFVHIRDAISEMLNAVHFNIKSCYQFICLSYIHSYLARCVAHRHREGHRQLRLQTPQ